MLRIYSQVELFAQTHTHKHTRTRIRTHAHTYTHTHTHRKIDVGARYAGSMGHPGRPPYPRNRHFGGVRKEPRTARTGRREFKR